MWIALLIIGFVLLGITIWSIRNGEAILLIWLEQINGEVFRSQDPVLFWIAIILQIATSLGLVIWGLVEKFANLGG